jgi:hypothetical protein
MIGKPAREKDTYRAYRAFRALLFGTPSPRTASPGMSAHNTQPCPLRIEIPPRRGDLVRFVLLVRTFPHKNKQDAGESASLTAKLLNERTSK